MIKNYIFEPINFNMKKIFTLLFILFSFFSFSQEKKEEEVFDWLPEQKKINRHSIGINVPLYYNPYANRAIGLYYEYLTFEGGAGFQFPIKYINDDILNFRGIFTGCDFVHHTTNHHSKLQFSYGGGINPGFFIWEPLKRPDIFKRQNSFALYFNIKMDLYYMFTDSFGFGIFWENAWIGRLDGFKQASPADFRGGGSMNLGIKTLYRF